MLYRHAPQALPGGANIGEPPLVDRDGVHLHRETIQAILWVAARANGSPTDELGSHSLRFGGASALWAANHESGLSNDGAAGHRTASTPIFGKTEKGPAE